MNDVKFRLMSLVSSSVINPVSVSITAPMVQAVNRVRIIVNISRNFKNTFVGLFIPVSYTHLDVYKRQTGSMI